MCVQINKHYHAIKGSAYSSEHIDQGVTFLIQLIKTMRRSRPGWTKEQQLRGGACRSKTRDQRASTAAVMLRTDRWPVSLADHLSVCPLQVHWLVTLLEKTKSSRWTTTTWTA